MWRLRARRGILRIARKLKIGRAVLETFAGPALDNQEQFFKANFGGWNGQIAHFWTFELQFDLEVVYRLGKNISSRFRIV